MKFKKVAALMMAAVMVAFPLFIPIFILHFSARKSDILRKFKFTKKVVNCIFGKEFLRDITQQCLFRFRKTFKTDIC